MGKRKRKLTSAEKAEKARRRQEFQTIFIHGKMKRVRRPPMIEGLSVDEFIRRNADPIFLHQEEMWEYLEANTDPVLAGPFPSFFTRHERESVSFINTQAGEDLVVAYALASPEPGEIFSLILQRHPEFEVFLPPEERGVSVFHEAFPKDELETARRIIVDGPAVDIETTIRAYQIDLSAVRPEEVARAENVLRRMHRHGGFELELR